VKKRKLLKISEPHNHSGGNLKDIILGGQDGVVNVLGLILGVAVATFDKKIVILAGLSSTFAESISMAAVAYTSTKAAQSYYQSLLLKEKQEIKKIPRLEKKEIYSIYEEKGFQGKFLESIVNKVTGDKKIWLKTLMAEKFGLLQKEYNNPRKSALIVGISSLVGSFIPLLPFFFFNVNLSILLSLILSGFSLFAAGMVKAKMTVGTKFKSGLEMLTIGMLAAVTGYLVGIIFNKVSM